VYSLDGGYSHSDKGFDKNIVSPRDKRRIDFLIKNNKYKVLDVGCASGSFVYSAKISGLDPVGIDLDKDSIKFGIKEGLDLRHGLLHDMKFEKESFDAVNLGNVIEHVKDPENLVLECIRILKKNGVLMVSTSNTNSYIARTTKWMYDKFGIMWSHPAPPYHLFDFSDKNLIKLLRENGVNMDKIIYSETPLNYLIYHTGYFDNIRKNMKGFSKKDILKGLIKSLSLNIPKQMVVALVYETIFAISKLFEKRGDWMIIYGVKK